MQKVSQKKSKNGKPKDINIGKLPLTEGVFLQHYLRSVVQARILLEATKARINHVNPQEYGSDEGFIAIATEGDIVPELLLTVFGCKLSKCAMRSCKNAASLARICVIAAMNFVKILIQRKF